MNAPRDHHFIPVFYLKQWAGVDGKLVEYTRKSGKLIPKHVGPKATGFQTDLYSFSELPPTEAQHIEQNFFGYADNIASDALAIHLNSPSNEWDPELRSAWSRFVIGVHLRHPDAMMELRVAAATLWKGSGEGVRRAYEAFRQPSDPATYEEYLAQRDPLTPIKACVNVIMAAIDNTVVGAHLNNMRWATVDVSTAPDRLLTSDRPVEIYNIKEPKGILALPISPTKLFIAVNDPELFAKFTKERMSDLVRKVNKNTVIRARRFVWSKDERQTRFIQNNMSKAMEQTPLFPNLGQYETPELL